MCRFHKGRGGASGWDLSRKGSNSPHTPAGHRDLLQPNQPLNEAPVEASQPPPQGRTADQPGVGQMDKTAMAWTPQLRARWPLKGRTGWCGGAARCWRLPFFWSDVLTQVCRHEEGEVPLHFRSFDGGVTFQLSALRHWIGRKK